MKYLYITLFILLFIVTCVYHHITHMDENDLRWLNVYNVGDTVFFYSQESDTDTMVIKDKYITNSFNPINNNPSVGTEYLAGGFIDYDISHNGDSINGYFFVRKNTNREPVYVYTGLCERSTDDYIPQKLEKFEFKGKHLNDCIIINSHNSNDREKEHKQLSYSLRYFIWSKSMGLILYSYDNGKTYRRN